MQAVDDLAAADIIRLLDLKPLPVEGGYFRETYSADLLLPASVLPPSIRSERPAKSVILYLLTAETQSRLHRLETDEAWHFYLGDGVDLHVFGTGFDYANIKLGHDLLQGQTVQTVVPAQSWFGARLQSGERWALMGCSLAPAYSDEDFSLPNDAEFGDLLTRFPRQSAVLHELR
ncbi:MAG: cupin domain-containing protein [Caldilineaceae bacterium SB0670_bin_27]|uniref:Cupin domain-containing protein n=1 Tax=Caldilineaceae bacterium SB0664_bin_27 TaxID=2605260 RepID=A0A6B0YV82_9CHLR|nr:cupin domain-containing protein [Caldilineaceae bacterium SB0664_bin_27]MYJ76816.1 cupin domain-containing protein [Caldilineaceae bacterium SB0670_bin_27]